MSRPARAGSAGKPVTIRATDVERERWERCAKVSDLTLSDWIRSRINDASQHEAALDDMVRKLARPGKRARGNSLENTGRSRRNPRR